MTGGPAGSPGIRAVALVVLDSVGVGGAPDAAAFGDEGSATLQNVAEAVGGLALANLTAAGLRHIADFPGGKQVEDPSGAYGVMVERSAGKDTTTGHWEIAGIILEKPFPLYPDGFPPEVIETIETAIGSGTLGNVPASGTEIIERLGEEHMRTGKPIVYTSGDSVFQIAAHVDVIPLERLYEMCRIAREILRGEHEVGRVIARPFRGAPGAFQRTPDRHDYSVSPPQPTVLDAVTEAGLEVRGVGKISDIFAGRGITASRPIAGNVEGIEAVIEGMRTISRGLVFANLVDFDSAYGHRNDPVGYAGALEEFDGRLPDIVTALGPDDVLVVTADHGNDPTTPSTDHSRERVPLIVLGERVRRGADLGERRSFADCGAAVADLLGVEASTAGRSFAADVLAT